MEEMDRSGIESILKTYVETRKRDESNGRDGNRRYFIKSLPDSDYPRVRKSCRSDDGRRSDGREILLMYYIPCLYKQDTGLFLALMKWREYETCKFTVLNLQLELLNGNYLITKE